MRAIAGGVHADSPEKAAATRREEHAHAWVRALWRFGKALAAKLGWRERSVQAWAVIQAEELSPSERMELAVDGLRDLGVPEEEAIAPVATLVRRLGYSLGLRLPIAGTFGRSPHLVLAGVLAGTSGVVSETVKATADKHVTPQEREEVESAVRVLEASIAELRVLLHDSGDVR